VLFFCFKHFSFFFNILISFVRFYFFVPNETGRTPRGPAGVCDLCS
jgi:hypothetical protein